MGFHHLAVVAGDMKAVDHFYEQVMGFDLVKVEVAPTPTGGWAKHFFYDTGNGELIAFWELHDETIGKGHPTALSRGMGLPEWVNHIAFTAVGPEDIERRKQRWLENGYDALEIDHGWCHSVYTTDPNGTLVEFCLSTGEFSQADRKLARSALEMTEFERTASPKPKIELHKAK